jgi:hypothetical protein
MTAEYAGRWALARSIVGPGAGPTMITCAGSATLRLHAGTIAYDEAVSFRLAKKLVRATRAYVFAASGGVIIARFTDGRPFFTLRLNADGIGTAVHQCGDDRYTLTLFLCDPAVWETRWDVSGTKQLSINTRYTRQPYTSTIAP